LDGNENSLGKYITPKYLHAFTKTKDIFLLHDIFLKVTLQQVWIGERLKSVMTLSGHSASVWSAVILPETGVMVTVSADCSLRTWMAGKCKDVVNDAHKQVHGGRT